MAYFDGFVIAVPTANKDKFREHASELDAVFIKHGAIRVVECWGDDVPRGTNTDFYGAVKATEDETIVFSFVEWPDKETRETGNAKIHEEFMAIGDEAMQMPFDGARMIYGGFEALVDLRP